MPQKQSHLVPEILRMRAAGATYREIAETLGASRNQITYWCNPRERERRSEEVARYRTRLAEQGRKPKKRHTPRKKQPPEVIAAREARKAERKAAAIGIRRAQTAARRARLSGKEFTLTEADIMALAQQTHCAKTGIAFEPYGDFIMSFDRISSFGGYTPGNVQAVCWMYNRAKGSNVEEAVLFMARKLVEQADRLDTVGEIVWE